jgi:hypothetical protein
VNLNPDSPVPYTLTPKAHAALADAPAVPLPDGTGEWACAVCGDAFFGTPPADMLCVLCQPGDVPAGGAR